MTDLKYIGETRSHFIVELRNGESRIGYGSIRKANYQHEVVKLLEDES